MKKNEKAVMVTIYVVIGLMGAAALTCIIISMITNQTMPYLTMGLGLGAVGNMIGLAVNLIKKGKNNGSGKDRNVS